MADTTPRTGIDVPRQWLTPRVVVVPRITPRVEVRPRSYER